MFKSKCTKHSIFAALLEVELLEKRTQLQREAHVKVKLNKKHLSFGALLEVEGKSARHCGAEKVHAVVAENISKLKGLKTDSF